MSAALFATLLTNRTLVMLSIGSAFRTMTQSALLTFLPVYLGARHGLFAALGRRLHVRPAGRGLLAAPIAGHLSDTIGRRQIIMSSMSMTAVVICS